MKTNGIMTVITVLVLVCVIYSCQRKVDKYFTSRELLDSIAGKGPDRFEFTTLYLFSLPSKNMEVGVVNSFDLAKIYYHQDDYAYFSNKLVYRDFKLLVKNLFYSGDIDRCGVFRRCFVLNDTVKRLYDREGFDGLVKSFADKRLRDEDDCHLKTDLSYNASLSVMYYGFLNGYFGSFDDIGGVFSLRRILKV